MNIELYQRVALRRDLPEHGLRSGDVATVTDFVAHPQGGARGCVLEVSNALGASIAIVAVGEADIEPLRADEILAVRALASAS